MDAAEVIERLQNLNVSVRAIGDRLLLEPGSRVPQDLVPDLRRCKLEILRLLGSPTPDRDDPTDYLLAWASEAAEAGAILAEPVHFFETPLRPYTTAQVGRYCREQLKVIVLARSSRATGGWGRFTPEWWTEMETKAIEALAALKDATEDVDHCGLFTTTPSVSKGGKW